MKTQYDNYPICHVSREVRDYLRESDKKLKRQQDQDYQYGVFFHAFDVEERVCGYPGNTTCDPIYAVGSICRLCLFPAGGSESTHERYHEAERFRQAQASAPLLHAADLYRDRQKRRGHRGRCPKPDERHPGNPPPGLGIAGDQPFGLQLSVALRLHGLLYEERSKSTRKGGKRSRSEASSLTRFR